MKKIIVFIASLLGICGLLYLGNSLLNKNEPGQSKNLIIYNWGDYVDPQLIKKFEKETGYKVIYETFDSNEAMFSKVKQGGTHYDIAIPSDYMIQKMKKAKLLVKLDKSKIKNLSNIDPALMNLSFDRENKYSVPYFWGTLGIVYNKNLPQKDIPKKWLDLWNKDLEKDILLVDSARDIMGLSLIDLGYSVNTTNDVQLDRAQKHLDKLAPNVKAIVADEIKMYMQSNEADVAVTWSGEAKEIVDNNSNMRYFVPKQGSNMWFDNIVIPKTSTNRNGAYKFINFMLEPKNAAQNAEYIGYSTPNLPAKKYLPKSTIADTEMYPTDEFIKKLQVYSDLNQKYIGEYNDKFLEFKMMSN